MQKQRIIKQLLAGLFVFVFVFFFFPLGRSSFNFLVSKARADDDEDKWSNYEDYVVVSHDTTWSGNLVFDDPNKDTVVVADGATLTIEKGTNIKLRRLLVYNGRIVAEGTKDEKIKFTSLDHEGGMIEFGTWPGDNEPSIFRYVEISKMGSYYDRDDGTPMSFLKNIMSGFLNTAHADDLVIEPALKFESGELRIENSSFLENYYFDVIVDASDYEGDHRNLLEIVDSDFEENSQDTALDSTYYYNTDYNEETDEWNEQHTGEKIILENNWYGNSEGPTEEGDSPEKGEKIFGDYTLVGYRNSKSISDSEEVSDDTSIVVETKVTSNDDSDDHDSKKNKKKNKKKNEIDPAPIVKTYLENKTPESGNVMGNVNQNVLGNKNENVFSDSNVNPDSEDLHEYKKKNKKLFGMAIWAFLFLVASGVAFLVFRRRIGKKISNYLQKAKK